MPLIAVLEDDAWRATPMRAAASSLIAGCDVRFFDNVRQMEEWLIVNTEAVVTFDPGEQPEGEPLSLAFARSHSSVTGWFEDWVNGVRLWDKMYERLPGDDLLFTNPFTRGQVAFPKLQLRR